MLFLMKQNRTSGLLSLRPAARVPCGLQGAWPGCEQNRLALKQPTLLLSPGPSWSPLAAFRLSGSQHGGCRGSRGQWDTLWLVGVSREAGPLNPVSTSKGSSSCCLGTV